MFLCKFFPISVQTLFHFLAHLLFFTFFANPRFYDDELGPISDRRLFDDTVKYGKPNPTQEEYCFEVNICPDLLVAAIGAFGALALGVLYVTITMEQTRRRRKRGAAGGDTYSSPTDPPRLTFEMIKDFVASGRILVF